MVLTRAAFWCVKVKGFLPRTTGGSSGWKISGGEIGGLLGEG